MLNGRGHLSFKKNGQSEEFSLNLSTWWGISTKNDIVSMGRMMVPDSPTKRRAILRCEGASTTSPIRLDGDGSKGIVGIKTGYPVLTPRDQL